MNAFLVALDKRFVRVAAGCACLAMVGGWWLGAWWVGVLCGVGVLGGFWLLDGFLRERVGKHLVRRIRWDLDAERWEKVAESLIQVLRPGLAKCDYSWMDREELVNTAGLALEMLCAKGLYKRVLRHVRFLFDAYPETREPIMRSRGWEALEAYQSGLSWAEVGNSANKKPVDMSNKPKYTWGGDWGPPYF